MAQQSLCMCAGTRRSLAQAPSPSLIPQKSKIKQPPALLSPRELRQAPSLAASCNLTPKPPVKTPKQASPQPFHPGSDGVPARAAALTRAGPGLAPRLGSEAGRGASQEAAGVKEAAAVVVSGWHVGRVGGDGVVCGGLGPHAGEAASERAGTLHLHPF